MNKIAEYDLTGRERTGTPGALEAEPITLPTEPEMTMSRILQVNQPKTADAEILRIKAVSSKGEETTFDVPLLSLLPVTNNRLVFDVMPYMGRVDDVFTLYAKWIDDSGLASENPAILEQVMIDTIQPEDVEGFQIYEP